MRAKIERLSDVTQDVHDAEGIWVREVKRPMLAVRGHVFVVSQLAKAENEAVDKDWCLYRRYNQLFGRAEANVVLPPQPREVLPLTSPIVAEGQYKHR